MNFLLFYKKFITPITIIVLIGLTIRIVFTLFFAELFWNRSFVYWGPDTDGWAWSIENLIKYGTYIQYYNHPTFITDYSYFTRLPGYSFFIGIFYILCNYNWNLAYPIIGYSQILLDGVSIYLIYKLTLNFFNNKQLGLIVALLYSLYPFIIVWTPIVYSESISIFLLLLGLYFLSLKISFKTIFWTSFIWGIGALFRPQLLFLFPLLFIYLLFINKNLGLTIKYGVLLTLTFLFTYGIWPARNYINYNKVILTQDLRGIDNWQEDVLSFMQYMYSVKSDWEPQISQIIKNKTVDYPFLSPVPKEDSLKFQKAVYLAKTCGSGFSCWENYWREEFMTPNCNTEIKTLFNELRENQIKNKPFEFFVTIPLLNLKKALFKSELTKQETLIQKLAGLLFYYRTLLILLGLFGCILLLTKKGNLFALGAFTLGYFLLVYLTLCAGTSPQMRNIEIRYFLHADILLLIPAGYLIHTLFKKINYAK